MVSPVRETVSEIAARTGRPIETVRSTWARRADWPAATGKRGRWLEYDRAEVDQWLADHITRPAPVANLEADRLYTSQQLEAAGIGISAGTIRADLSRGRWPKPDDEADGVKRWTGKTALDAVKNRRGYRRKTDA
ncbi:hypothetical protein AB0A77_28385 [Streptomyces varsoviensis]|uniref:hypothetical protein n=1 Tax=Streptomyces varsoviensis TaxID=67373 RepID=UPI0033F680E6